MAKYLNVEFGTGRIYERSTEKKEGYEEFTSSKGNTSYRKYYPKGLYGTLTAIEKRDSPIGEQIQLTLKDKSGEYNNLQFGLYDANGNVDNRFAESLIRTLPNVKINTDYRIFPYVIEKSETSKYGSSGVSIVRADLEAETANKEDKVPVAYRYLTKDEIAGPNDVPKLVFKEQRGKNRPTATSMEEKTNFLYDVLMRFVTPSTKKEEPSAPAPAKKPEPASAQPFVVDSPAAEQKLPF